MHISAQRDDVCIKIFIFLKDLVVDDGYSGTDLCTINRVDREGESDFSKYIVFTSCENEIVVYCPSFSPSTPSISSPSSSPSLHPYSLHRAPHSSSIPLLSLTISLPSIVPFPSPALVSSFPSLQSLLLSPLIISLSLSHLPLMHCRFSLHLIPPSIALLLPFLPPSPSLPPSLSLSLPP